MLFYQNLDKIVFNRNKLFKCDELVIISGYVGPHPIRQLQTLPLSSTVIYGMYGCEGIRKSLHSNLLEESKNLDHTTILYSTIPVHSKIYLWKYNGEIVHALVGSANFSVNGLTTPFKEVLAETTYDTFDPLNQYLKMILDKSIDCKDAVVSENKKKASPDPDYMVYDPDVCTMPLFIIESNQKKVPSLSGINWGMSRKNGSHVNLNDAYIRIGSDLLEHYPQLFPPKQKNPTSDDVGKKGHRHNDNIEIIWDDGTSMVGLLEGTINKEFNGRKEMYPKQISSSPSKAELGRYIRKRLGKDEGEPILYDDLVKYGRDTIDVSLQGEGIYYFDFSV